MGTAGGDVDGNSLSWKNVRGPLLAGAFAIGLGAGVALTRYGTTTARARLFPGAGRCGDSLTRSLTHSRSPRSTITFERSNIASTEIIDRKSPSNAVCIENGYSAIVMDQRVFVSFNPYVAPPYPRLVIAAAASDRPLTDALARSGRFNVYVSQPEVKPGCVLRKSNSAILEKKGIISANEAASCKRNMNRHAPPRRDRRRPARVVRAGPGTRPPLPRSCV